MSSVFMVIVTGAIFGATGYALGVNVGMEVFKRILIETFDEYLDDEDTLSVAAIKEIIKGEEDENDE